jgi:light-regulated signal transduction histidine kinase (bacteriophytochrome)
MRDYKILTAQGDPQSLREMGGYPDSTSGALKSGVDENMVSLLKIMSHDIRGPLMSMVSTLKLLNRGYYGKMDEQAADKIQSYLERITASNRFSRSASRSAQIVGSYSTCFLTMV